MSRYLLVVLFLLLAKGVHAQEQELACAIGEKSTQIYFGNGVNTSLAEARLSRNSLVYAYRVNNDIEQTYPDEEFAFILAYNRSRGLVLDLLETINQKVDETGGLTAGQILFLMKLSKKAALSSIEAMSTATGGGRIVVSLAVDAVDAASDAYIEKLENDAEYLSRYYEETTTSLHVQKYTSDLQEGKKVIVVAHSQGNLFANNAVAEVVNRYPEYVNSIGIVGVANPAGIRVGTNQYVTADDDRVIDALRISHSVLGSNLDNDPGFFDDPRDSLNHGFLTSYMASELTIEYANGNTLASRAVIDDLFLTLLGGLEYPESELTDGAIKITLEWGNNPDVDLHVYEPNGEHVYYRNFGGVSGYLDLDDTDGVGPEHYYVGCDTLEEGRYTVGVNYYRGSSQETARIQISTADGRTINTSQVLIDSLGSSGNDSPILMADIDVAINESGEYTYQTSLR